MLTLICLAITISFAMTFNITKQPYGILMCKDLHLRYNGLQYYNPEQFICTIFNQSRPVGRRNKRRPKTFIRYEEDFEEKLFIIKGKTTYHKGKRSCEKSGSRIAVVNSTKKHEAAVEMANGSGLEFIVMGMYSASPSKWLYSYSKVKVTLKLWAEGHPRQTVPCGTDSCVSYFCGMEKQRGYKWVPFGYGHSIGGVLCEKQLH